MEKKKKVKKDDRIKVVADYTKQFLNLMGIDAGVDVSVDPSKTSMLVYIDAKAETGLLIGNRGRTLNSLQMLVGMAMRQKFGEWQRVILDVSNWRQKEEERLTQLALQTAERVKTTGEPQQLYNLTSSQRRIVHMSLSEDKDVKTESQGEGQDRYLVVSPSK